jgi:hypothetical protein
MGDGDGDGERCSWSRGQVNRSLHSQEAQGTTAWWTFTVVQYVSHSRRSGYWETGLLTCIAGSSRDADPGHDRAATATGSLENSSRVVGLISSKDKDGRAIRTEVEHVPLRRQGIESFFCGRAEEASLKPWNTPGEQTRTPGRSTAKGFTVAKRSELGKGL